MSEVKKLSKLEILNETIQFYSEDTKRRATTFEGFTRCAYNTEDGRHCAVGRCLLKKHQEEGIEFNGNFDCGVGYLAEKHGKEISYFDEMLEEQYRGHEIKFWEELQSLHDSALNWGDEKGLTEEGKNKVKDIKQIFGITE